MSFTEKLKNTMNSSDLQNMPKVINIGTDPNTDPIRYRNKGIPSIPSSRVNNKVNDMVTDLVKKIKKTPCWDDFSSPQQEQMICKYFDAKITKGKYAQVNFSHKDKVEFTQDVLNRLK